MERYPTKDEVGAALTRHRARRERALSRAYIMIRSNRLPLPHLRHELRMWFDEREAYLYSFIADGRLSGVAVAGAEQARRMGTLQTTPERQGEASASALRDKGSMATAQAVADGVAR